MDKYLTRNIVAADAASTIIIVKKGDTATGHEFGYMTVLKDTAHTIAFYDGDPAGAAGTFDLIGTKPASIAANTYRFDRTILKGLYAVVAASFAGDIVIGFK